jgi:hypothetical protein
MLYDGNDACYGLVLGTWRRDGDVVRFTWVKERFYDVALDNAMFAGGMRKIGRRVGVPRSRAACERQRPRWAWPCSSSSRRDRTSPMRRRRPECCSCWPPSSR